MLFITNLTISPTKDTVLRYLYGWCDNSTICSGSRWFFTDLDWENDKYKNSIILNNIQTLIYGYINEHQREKDYKETFYKFILDLIDEVNRLFV